MKKLLVIIAVIVAGLSVAVFGKTQAEPLRSPCDEPLQQSMAR